MKHNELKNKNQKNNNNLNKILDIAKGQLHIRHSITIKRQRNIRIRKLRVQRREM